MNKIKEFTDAERKYYGDIYSKLTMNTDELEDIWDRRYSKRLSILKDYLEKIDDADYKANGKGIFEAFKDDEIYKKEVLLYKNKIQKDLNLLEICSKCKCSTCSLKCQLSGCKNCLHNELVFACDKKDNTIFKGMNNIELLWEDRNTWVTFKVVGRLIINSEKSEYILLEDIKDADNVHLYKYVKYKNGDEEYVSLTDEEIERVWDIFVNNNCE